MSTLKTGNSQHPNLATPSVVIDGISGAVTFPNGYPAPSGGGGGSMTQLATGTLSGSSVSLTNISQNYKDLRLIIKNAQGAYIESNLTLQFNDVTNVNFQTINIGMNDTYGGTDANVTRVRAWTTTYLSLTYGEFDLPQAANNTAREFIIHDYTNTAANKIVSGFGGVEYYSYTGVMDTKSRWFSNNAVTSISINQGGPFFTAGTYTLYGVK